MLLSLMSMFLYASMSVFAFHKVLYSLTIYTACFQHNNNYVTSYEVYIFMLSFFPFSASLLEILKIKRLSLGLFKG